MTNNGLYAGKWKEIKENYFEIPIIDIKGNEHYIFFIEIKNINNSITTGWKKRNILGKIKIRNYVSAFSSFNEKHFDLLKGIILMIANYCCLYAKIEKDKGIDALIGFAMESLLMEESRGILVGLK